MITTDFEYYKTYTIDETITLYKQLQTEGKDPLYYNGGTEIITLMRTNNCYTNTKAVIDLKAIPECTFKGIQQEQYIIGASVTLADLQQDDKFPLLAKVCSRIADHTSREKITIGGNVCGNIIYREAVLPLLLTDCVVVIAGEKGMTEIPIQQIFNEQMQLVKGSFIVQFKMDKKYLKQPFTSKKVTKISRIGYPLITVATMKMNGKQRFAFSGICAFPFRMKEMEDILNDKTMTIEEKMNHMMKLMPSEVLDDMEGSAAYREFVLQNVLEESIHELAGVGNDETYD